MIAAVRQRWHISPSRWSAAWLRCASSSTPHPCHSREMLNGFDPQQVEAGVADWWEAHDGKHRKAKKTKFSMVLPPPNVTGQLHIGHALMATVQDSVVRHHKMLGENVTWVPGVDHAGIATQTVVERKLLREGLTRHDLGREKFLEQVWNWVDKYSDRIIQQLRRMGTSLDWKKKVFTLDQPRSQVVLQTFVDLYKQGMVYREKRLVNWCPYLRTVISDLETDHEEVAPSTKIKIPGRQAPVEFGIMHDFAYQVQGGGQIIVSTTRLETMLGDTAIAVHPDDERYKSFHGRFAVHPFFPDRVLPIVLDAQLVDPQVGSGAVKITPAHDMDDFACGQRHGLSSISILNDDGTLNSNTGAEWESMDRFDAREKLVERLKALGLYKGKRPNPMRIARCSRSGDIIEPMLKPQWFVRCDQLAKRALRFSEEGELNIQPPVHRKTWRHFLENIQDWCVSRQLWWGHRIPAYRVVSVGENEPERCERWVVAMSEEEAKEEAQVKFGLSRDSFQVHQDEDVLDTWFSSSLFPLTALGYGTPQFEKGFYPVSLMETGSDILFFWVARMVMMCSQVHEPSKPPFKDVFLHPIVRDKQGRKMSKSLGNVIDPLHVIDGVSLDVLLEGVRSGNLDEQEVSRASNALRAEFPEGIPACGTDALRLTLASYMTHSDMINMDVSRVVTWRLFGNKLWNAVRFVLIQNKPFASHEVNTRHKDLPIESRWILGRLDKCVKACNQGYRTLELAKVTQALYDFLVLDFCDVYVEASKRLLRSEQFHDQALQVLIECIEVSLRLLHPIAPFITEELWHRIMSHPSATGLPSLNKHNSRTSYTPSDMLVMQPFPEEVYTKSWDDPVAESHMTLLLDCVYATRGLREKLVGVLDSATLSERIEFVAPSVESETVGQIVAVNLELIKTLTRMKNVSVVLEDRVGSGVSPSNALEHAVRNELVARLPVQISEGEATRIQDEILRVEKQRDKIEKQREKLNATLTSEKYMNRAPRHVQEKDHARLVDLQASAASLQATIDTLRSLTNQK